MERSEVDDTEATSRNSRSAARKEQLVESSTSLRRSTREPELALLEKSDTQKLLEKIRKGHEDTVVLKIKDHMLCDINTAVLEAIIEALHKNKKCQALYIQNISRAVHDEQLMKLTDLLKRKMIWCLNIGENYEITGDGWEAFCKQLPLTNITHIYISEHVISRKLKNKIRFFIRENRKKHRKHCDFKNLSVIRRCTNMWWNPINGVKELKPPPPEDSESEVEEEVESDDDSADQRAARLKEYYQLLKPTDTRYWEARYNTGVKPWKFKCHCGIECAWNEKAQYQPEGRSYECTVCSIWSHVDCNLGPNVSDKAIQRRDVLCRTCEMKARRIKRYEGEEAWARIVAQAKRKAAGGGDDEDEEQELQLEGEGQWTFRCKCGEECSYYENPRYHPDGQWFLCTRCKVWSHVHCIFGPKATSEEVACMEQALCFSCSSKVRRNRSSNQKCRSSVATSLSGNVDNSNNLEVTTNEGNCEAVLTFDQKPSEGEIEHSSESTALNDSSAADGDETSRGLASTSKMVSCSASSPALPTDSITKDEGVACPQSQCIETVTVPGMKAYENSNPPPLAGMKRPLESMEGRQQQVADPANEQSYW